MNKTINKRNTNKLIVVILLILSMIIPLFMPLLQVSADSLSEFLDVEVQKVWDGDATEYVVITLLADGVVVEDRTITADEGWKTTFTDLIRINDVSGKEISYTVEEVEIEGYDVEIIGSMTQGFIITNTQIIDLDDESLDNKEDEDNLGVFDKGFGDELGKTSINVEKQWIGTKLSSATVRLLANGTQIDTIILNDSNDWKHTFDDLDTHYDDAGILVENEYSIQEVAVPGYQTIISNSGNDFVIINIEELNDSPIIPQTFNLNVRQDWVGTPTSSSSVVLYVNGVLEDTLTFNALNNWEGSFDNLDIFDNFGERYLYEVKEVSIDDYTSILTGSVESGFVVTSRENSAPLSIRVDKIWIGQQLNQVVVALVANSEIVDTVTLNSAKNWSHTFTDLPEQTADGQTIVYSVMEYENQGYLINITGNQNTGFVITSTEGAGPAIPNHNPSKTFVNVRKVWNSGGEDKATVALVADGEVINVVVLNESNGWTNTFFELPMYDRFNKVINYSVMEFGTEGYTSKITGNAEDGFVITNTKNNDRPSQPRPPVNAPVIEKKTTVSVTKVWVGKELENARVNLLAEGKVVDSATLTQKNNWKHNFVNLPETVHGIPINYKVEEVEIDGYKVEVKGNARTGFVVINTELKPGQGGPNIPIEPQTFKDLKVKNIWVGQSAEEIEVILYADEIETKRVILNTDNNWEHTFKNLIEKEEGTMDSILYTIIEVPVEGYESEIKLTYEDVDDGFHTGWIITNYKIGAEMPNDSQLIDVHVRTVWVGKKQENNTVYLNMNKEVIETVVLNEDNNWEHSFRDLVKYNEDGRLNLYSITTEPIKGYISSTNDAAQPYGFVVRIIEDAEYDGVGDRAPTGDYIEDVQTYDGGPLMMIIGLILSVISLACLSKKKKQL